MSARSIRILCQIDWVDEAETVTRLWDGSGLYVDADGEVWIGSAILTSLDHIDMAISGEAATLNVELAGVQSAHADSTYLSFTNDEIVGSRLRLFIQPCHPLTDQPVGSPETKFTGTIDNIIFRDKATAANILSTLTLEVTNRFTLRRLTSGAALSDTDQRARSAILNPAGEPDRFCERVPLMADKNVVWPRFN